MSFVKNTFEEIINTDHKVITEESSKTILKKYGVKVPGFALANLQMKLQNKQKS